MKLSSFDLRLFSAIADHGGIAPAARRLGLTKSLVSRQLIGLEERLGTRLVQRTTRKASLTEAGELLASYARRVTEEMEAAEAAIEAMREKPSGDLRVSLPFSIVRFVLLPHLAAFRRRHPGIRLSIDASTRIIDLVEEGFDLAVRIGELPPSSLVSRRLAVADHILVASAEYLARRPPPATPEQLVSHDILDLSPNLGAGAWTLIGPDGRKAEVPVAPVMAILDPSLLLDAAGRGLGIAMVPSLYARACLRNGTLQRVLPGWSRGSKPIHVVYPSKRSLAPKVRAFIEFLTELLGDEANRASIDPDAPALPALSPPA
jgi:DNA-binding transcriptional LysR family regulator